jgi:hypothetical protein
MLSYVFAIGRRVIGYLLAYWSMPRGPEKPSKHGSSRRDPSGRQ